MASLDRNGEALVVRIVYDGPPTAGKTTSLRALALRFGTAGVYTPEESVSGRTLFFDWMEYVGGRFDGRQIHCQIVSVPGQVELSARRALLIGSADAIVFVFDTSPAGMSESAAGLESVRAHLREKGGPPVGIVLQANKRDLAGAESIERLRGTADIAVIESVASRGDGIREAFVFAVRLALDRVRELMRTGQLTENTADDDAGVLLAQMRSIPLDAGARELWPEEHLSSSPSPSSSLSLSATPSQPPAAPSSPAPPSTPPTSTSTSTLAARATRPPSSPVPRMPDVTIPSGWIWPPISGRVLLQEATAKEPTTLRELSQKEWMGDAATGWRFHSSSTDVFADTDVARAALITWAQLHTSLAGWTSARRLIALCDAGDGADRLWQVVRSETSLWRAVSTALASSDPAEIARHVEAAVAVCRTAAERWAQAPFELPCTLETIGAADSTFISLMPNVERLRPVRAQNRRQKLLRQLRVLVQGQLGSTAAVFDPIFDNAEAECTG